MTALDRMGGPLGDRNSLRSQKEPIMDIQTSLNRFRDLRFDTNRPKCGHWILDTCAICNEWGNMMDDIMESSQLQITLIWFIYEAGNRWVMVASADNTVEDARWVEAMSYVTDLAELLGDIDPGLLS